MKKIAVVTGAGSGVGRAVATKLVAQGWHVALLGRTAANLEETARLAPPGSSGQFLVHPCDIGNAASVKKMGEVVSAKLGLPDVLVNSAGTNVPKRSLQVLALDDYHQMLATNLNGAYYCIQAFLAGMRQRKSGTIVNVISDAGRQANAKAGPAYVISKFGLAGLTQSINTEERQNGIRACAIFPGDINTPLLDRRPSPPPAAAREKMLQPEDVADCVLLAINLPPRALVEEIVIRPP